MTGLDESHANENICWIITTVIGISFGLTHLHTYFYRSSHRLRVFFSSLDWLTRLPVFFVICVSDFFGFGHSIKNRS